MLGEYLFETRDVFVLKQLRLDKNGTLIARYHVDSLYDVAHLAAIEPFSLPNFEDDMLPEDHLVVFAILFGL